MSKFCKESKEGKFVTFLYEDVRTLYEGFRRGAKESSKSLSSRAENPGKKTQPSGYFGDFIEIFKNKINCLIFFYLIFIIYFVFIII